MNRKYRKPLVLSTWTRCICARPSYPAWAKVRLPAETAEEPSRKGLCGDDRPVRGRNEILLATVTEKSAPDRDKQVALFMAPNTATNSAPRPRCSRRWNG